MADLLDELLVGLGFDYDPKEMAQFKEDIGKTVSIVKELTKVASIAAGTITAMTVASTAASDEQGKFAAEIGETVENVTALQFALQRSGGSSDGMSNSLRNLSVRISEAARGIGSGVEAFSLLGISAQNADGSLKSSSSLMLEISEAMQGMERQQQIELADKLGIGDSLPLLQHGTAEMLSLMATAEALGVTTAEDAAIAAEFQDSLLDLWTVLKQVSRIISKEVAPVLKSAIDLFTSWWIANRDILEQNFPAFVEKAVVALKLLTLAAAAFIGLRLVMHLAQLLSVLKGVTVATMAANAAAALMPALIVGAATALVALAEDAMVFFQGGDSFFGSMVEKFPEWRTQIEAVAKVLIFVAELTGTIVDGWVMLIDSFANMSLDGLTEVLGNLPGFAADRIGAGFGAVSDFFSPTPSIATSNVRSMNVDKIEISVTGNSDPEATANTVVNRFLQESNNLNSAVDQ